MKCPTVNGTFTTIRSYSCSSRRNSSNYKVASTLETKILLWLIGYSEVIDRNWGYTSKGFVSFKKNLIIYSKLRLKMVSLGWTSE